MEYYRHITRDNYASWTHRRHTGLTVRHTHSIQDYSSRKKIKNISILTLKCYVIIELGYVSWHFTKRVEPDRKYVGDNKMFIQIVNILHAGHTITANELKKIRYSNLNGKDSIKCDNYGKVQGYEELVGELLKKYDDISYDPVHSSEVTDDTLERAASVLFYLVHCPTDNVEMKDYYLNLLDNFPLPTILTTLGRLSSAALESQSVKLTTATLLLARLGHILERDFRRLITLTTPASLLGKTSFNLI